MAPVKYAQNYVYVVFRQENLCIFYVIIWSKALKIDFVFYFDRKSSFSQRAIIQNK